MILAAVGSISVGLALVAALCAAGGLFWSLRRDGRGLRWARGAIYAVAGFLGLALLALAAAFLGDRFQVAYVALHSNRALPLYFKFSALWAGQEGSLLLWSFLQALFAALIARRSRRNGFDEIVLWASVFLNLVTAFFVAVTLFLSNPFVLYEMVPLDGRGLNPLLRHPGMIFHPPALYVGYVGLSVPFALALAALVTRRVADWTAAARRWTLAAWLFLGLGLILGARWAYDVLGWGGYWGWDPVENAGLMPWLVATALLHGMAMQERGRAFRTWNILLAVLSFALVLFGAFTTRSGLIESVHSFSRSDLGVYFLAAIGVVVVGSLALVIVRQGALVAPRSSDALFSRGGMVFLTLLLLLLMTTSVLIGSLLPLITELLFNRRFEATPGWFDRAVGPQFGALGLLMGACPLLGRAAITLKQLRARGWPALIGAILLTVGAALAGFAQPVSLAAFAVVGLAGGTTLAVCAWDVIGQVRRERGAFLQALWGLFRRTRRRCGGYLAHAGVILVALGVIGTRMYSFETEVALSRAEPVTVRGYTLVLEGLEEELFEERVSARAVLSVYRGGVYLATLRPQVDWYAAGQTVSLPALRAGLREDLYVVLGGWGREEVVLKVFVNPLVNFLWLGALVFLAGGVMALLPASGPVRCPNRVGGRCGVGDRGRWEG